MRGIPDEQIRITVDCPEAAAASWPSRAQEPIARHVRRPDEHRSVGAARWAGVVRDRPSPSQNAMHLGLPTFSKVPPDSPEGWPGVRHSASGARSVRQFVGIMIVSHSAFTGGASHGGARPDQRPGVISVIEGVLGGADIPYQVTDRNMSVLRGLDHRDPDEDPGSGRPRGGSL